MNRAVTSHEVVRRDSIAAVSMISSAGVGSIGSNTNRTESYQSPKRTKGPLSRPATSHRLVDKKSVVFREFTATLKRRKRLIKHLSDLAMDAGSSSSMLKRYLMELRSLTLTMIEDALEIEYRSKLTTIQPKMKGRPPQQLPPLAASNIFEDKDDMYALSECLRDTDHLLKFPNVRVFLPHDFPDTRNPFLLGKSVDELALMEAPAPQKGNLNHELKVLELLRYRRAARALLKSEAQALNKLPISMDDLNRIWDKSDDPDVEIVMRAVITVMVNDDLSNQVDSNRERGPDYGYLNLYKPMIEPYDFLNRLNSFRFSNPVRLDVQAAMRQALNGCNYTRIARDNAVGFLIEWLNSALAYVGGAPAASSPSPSTYKGINTGASLNGTSIAGSIKNLDAVGAPRGIDTSGPNIGMTNTGQGNMTPYGMAGTGAGVGSNSEMEMEMRVHNFQEQSPNGGQIPAYLHMTPGGQPMFDDRNRQMNTQMLGDIVQPMPSTDSVDNISVLEDSIAPVEGLDQDQNLQTLQTSPVTRNGKDTKMHKTKNGSLSSSASGPIVKNMKREVDVNGIRKQKADAAAAMKKKGGSSAGVTMSASMNTAMIPDAFGAVSTPNPGDGQALEALRFELLRMQQELLRRKVLDPRHYKAVSLDVNENVDRTRLRTNLAALTQTINTGEEEPVKGKAKESLLCEKWMKDVKIPLQMEIALDPMLDTVIGRTVRIHDANTIKEEPLFSIGDKEIIFHTALSKLSFNRLTNQVLDDILDVPPGTKIGPKFKQLWNFMRKKVNDEMEEIDDIPHGFLEVPLDKSLFEQQVVAGGAPVKLTVLRNDNDDGIVVTATPAKSNLAIDKFSAPISLAIHDKELLVLLINQRGLFRLAQTKWSCMEMVAQWVSSRLEVLRIFPGGDPVKAPQTNTNRMIGGEGSIDETFGSSVSLLSATQSKELNARSMDHDALTRATHSTAFEEDELGNPLNGATGAPLASIATQPVLLEMKLDRSVEINTAAMMQWTARRFPRVEQASCTLSAMQEMEMLDMTATITMPDEVTRIKEKAKNEPIDFAKLPEGLDPEEFFEDELALTSPSGKKKRKEDMEERIPIVLKLSTRLTGFELGIFGVTRILDDHKVALNSNNAAAPNPSDFMWNVINRMILSFKGDPNEPYHKKCSAENIKNWEIDYDRRLMRDIRTVSGGVMVVTVSATGKELLFDAEPTNGSIYEKVGSKLFSEQELVDIVLGEGWPLNTLEASSRLSLAYRIVDRLKVVRENATDRLEFYNFPERRMLEIVVSTGNNRPQQPIGNIEINDHITLNDLRTLLTHELDKEVLPRLYRFHYKNGPCAVRQEAFRRAWDLLPKCVLLPRSNKDDDEKKKKEKTKKEGIELDKDGKVIPKKVPLELKIGSRRVNNKLVPIPIMTLGRIEEDTGNLFILHDARNHIVVGDVVRVGNIMGRDYIVGSRSKKMQEEYPNLFRLEPVFSMMMEDAFDLPTQSNMPAPKKSVLTKEMRKWFPPSRDKFSDLDYYQMAFDARGKVIKADQNKPSWQSMNELAVPPPAAITGVNAIPTDAIGTTSGGELGPELTSSMDGTSNPQSRNDLDEVRKAEERSKEAATKKKTIIWKDVWLWKCIPKEEDERPNWRKEYDNGEVEYKLEYQFTEEGKMEEGIVFFRYFCPYRIMEVLCIDSRLPELTCHHQRINEMTAFDVDYYTKMAYNEMINWFPQFTQGIDMNKWLKMLDKIRVFPDMKKPSRMGQCEQIFVRETRGEYGIAEKYVTYEGVCRALQDIALIRFPPIIVDSATEDGDDLSSVVASTERTDDDMSSIASMSSTPSIASTKSGKGKKVKGKKGEESKSKKQKDKEKNAAAMAELTTRPVVDPVQAAVAYRKLIINFLMNIPDWAEIVWRDAKKQAMDKEALWFAAASRIAAVYRGCRMTRIYKQMYISMTKLQAHVRRRMATRQVKKMLTQLMEDWLFRYRFRAATLFNALVRRFLVRMRHGRIMGELMKGQIKIFKMRRKRKRKLRKKERSAILYKETKRVGGHLILMKIVRKDKRNYSKDYGIVIEVYLPESQDTFKFEVEEPELRRFMMAELKVDALGVGELMDKRNLQQVIDARLLCKSSPRPGQKPHISFSRQALGQKGKKVLVRGRVISGDLFVISLYESGVEFVAQCYHRLTSKVFTVFLSTPSMDAWVREDYQNSCTTDVDKHKEPPLLRAENRKKLHIWMVDRLQIDTRRRTYRLIFECQAERSRKITAIRMMQSLWRRALIRALIPGWLDHCYLKIRANYDDPDSHYYIDRRTGESFWEKPKLLRGNELPTQPVYIWVDIGYYDHQGYYYEQYVNPITGQFSHLSIDAAARVIQNLVRSFQIRPFVIHLNKIDKSLSIQRSALKNYQDSGGKKLVHVINLALIKHLIEGKEDEARDLYEQCMQISDSNPLVTRCVAIFLLGTCDPPKVPNREKAIRLFKDAHRRDETGEKFQLAYDTMYRYALLRRPKDYKLLCALGVCEWYVWNNKERAERVLRRAVALAPFEERVQDTWSTLRDEFPERQLVFRPAAAGSLASDEGAKMKIIHGRQSKENSLWAGWVYCLADPDDLRTRGYWYDPATGERSETKPDFYSTWTKRKERSKFEKAVAGLEYYYDPMTSAYFQYHVLSDTYQ